MARFLVRATMGVETMTRCRLPFLLLVASLPASPVLAAAPDSDYMRSDRYPARVTAIDFGSRRVTFDQPMLLNGWQAYLRPNGLRNRHGIWIPARCRRDGDVGWRRCGFRLTQALEMARPKPSRLFAVFDKEAGRWQRGPIGCPSAITLEPAGPSGDAPPGPPGSQQRRRS